MLKHEDGSVTYTAGEMETIDFAVGSLSCFVTHGPWTFEDVFDGDKQKNHDYRVGRQLLHGKPWTKEDEDTFDEEWDYDHEEWYRGED